jgi:peptidoglycan/LPS O-acetylase OafA/YrhL
VPELDGLRGLLATGVFFHHCAVHRAYQATGIWARPSSPFYAALGELSVVLFFLITGYLFWRRVLEGRQPPPVRFLPAPTYWIAMAGCGLVTVGLAAATYRWVEHPFLRSAAAHDPARALPGSPVP